MHLPGACRSLQKRRTFDMWEGGRTGDQGNILFVTSSLLSSGHVGKIFCGSKLICGGNE
jgi:hypothetical protein